MLIAKISFYSLIFLIQFIVPQQIIGMESYEQSIQENLNILDQHIFKTTMLINKQKHTVQCTHEKYTQSLVQQKNNEPTSLFSCGVVDDVISQEEINFKKASRRYEELQHKKEKLEKAFILFQSKFDRGKRPLTTCDNDNFEYIDGIHTQTYATYYLETVAQDLARYIKEES